jgi:hypothetical protein
VLVAAPLAFCLVGLSMLAYGIGPWVNFVEWTSVFHAHLLTEFVRDLLRTTITVYAAARMEGASAQAAQAAQLVFGLTVMARAIIIYRRRGADAHSIALVLLAAIVALPHANHYDLAVAMPAVTVALFAEGDDRLLPFTAAAVLWMAPIFAPPFGAAGLPVVPVAVAAVTLWAAFATSLNPSRRGGAARTKSPQFSL